VSNDPERYAAGRVSALLRDIAESDLDTFHEQKADDQVPTILNLWLGRIRKSGCYFRCQLSA
jgi:hypothetical protein